VLWATPVTLSTAVTAAMWTSAVVLALFETVAAFRSPLNGAQKATQVWWARFSGAGSSSCACCCIDLGGTRYGS